MLLHGQAQPLGKEYNKKIHLERDKITNLMKKLLLGFSSVILLLIITSGITYFQFNGVNDKYTNTIEENTKKTELITYSIMETYRQQLFMSAYLVSGEIEEIEMYKESQARTYLVM